MLKAVTLDADSVVDLSFSVMEIPFTDDDSNAIIAFMAPEKLDTRKKKEKGRHAELHDAVAVPA